MDNPFFKNNGPFKLRDILRDLKLENNQNDQDQNIIDIKDLQNSKSNEITFFHSKKYKTVANNTKAPNPKSAWTILGTPARLITARLMSRVSQLSLAYSLR